MQHFKRRPLPIVKSVGSGGTTLAAFHAALVELNVGHYNLIRLSSVVPRGVHIDASGEAPAPTGSWGDRLYCVYGEQRASIPGQEAWAGIGWIERLDGGGGLLVEHEGESEQAVSSAIDTSLRSMRSISSIPFSEPDRVLVGATCVDRPICALVMAPFYVAPWQFADDQATSFRRVSESRTASHPLHEAHPPFAS